MDGERLMVSAGENPQMEELLRVNAELGAELRALRAGRVEAPRQGRVTAGRGIARLQVERNALETRLAETQVALEASEEALESVQAHREGLELQNQEMAVEIVRLRTGMRGLMRRARSQLLERAGLFGAR